MLQVLHYKQVLHGTFRSSIQIMVACRVRSSCSTLKYRWSCTFSYIHICLYWCSVNVPRYHKYCIKSKFRAVSLQNDESSYAVKSIGSSNSKNRVKVGASLLVTIDCAATMRNDAARRCCVTSGIRYRNVYTISRVSVKVLINLASPDIFWEWPLMLQKKSRNFYTWREICLEM